MKSKRHIITIGMDKSGEIAILPTVAWDIQFRFIMIKFLVFYMEIDY